MTLSRQLNPLFLFAANAVLLLLFSPSLAAQNGGRGFLKGHAGLTLGVSSSKLSAGGGFGVRLTKHLDLFAEAGSLQDVMTRPLQDELDAIALLTAVELGAPVNLTATIPAQYGLIGTRIALPLKSVITPFFEIAGGAARYTLDLHTRIGGFNLAPLLRTGFGELTDAQFMLSGTAGAHLAVTQRFGFDFAYRYYRISTESPGIAGSQVHIGIVHRF